MTEKRFIEERKVNENSIHSIYEVIFCSEFKNREKMLNELKDKLSERLCQTIAKSVIKACL